MVSSPPKAYTAKTEIPSTADMPFSNVDLPPYGPSNDAPDIEAASRSHRSHQPSSPRLHEPQTIRMGVAALIGLVLSVGCFIVVYRDGYVVAQPDSDRYQELSDQEQQQLRTLHRFAIAVSAILSFITILEVSALIHVMRRPWLTVGCVTFALATCSIPAALVHWENAIQLVFWILVAAYSGIGLAGLVTMVLYRRTQ